MLMTALTMVALPGRGDLADKGLVDLEGIDGKFPQIAEAGIAGAKIVDRDLNIPGPQGVEDGLRGFGVLHQHALGQLQLQATGVEAGALEGGENAARKLSLRNSIAETLTAMLHAAGRPPAKPGPACTPPAAPTRR